MAYKQKINNADKRKGFVYLDVIWDEQLDKSGITIDSMIADNCSGTGIIAAFIGEAGTGKTTALRRLEYLYAKRLNNRFDELPVFVELKNIGHGKDKLLHAIGDVLGTDESYTRQLLKEKSLVLLLDGMNEIPVPQFVADVRREVETLYSNNKKLKIYMTDRVNQSMIFDITSTRVLMYHLHALSQSNKEEYLRKNANSVSRHIIEDLIQNNSATFINDSA